MNSMTWLRLIVGLGIGVGAIWYFTREQGPAPALPDVDERDLARRFDKVQAAAKRYGDEDLQEKVAKHLRRAAAEADFGDIRKASTHVRQAEQAVIAWAM